MLIVPVAATAADRPHEKPATIARPEKPTRSTSRITQVTADDTVRVVPDQLHQLMVVTAKNFSFQTHKSAIGQIAFNEDMSAPVLPPYPGRVVRTFASVGDQVQRGDPLLEYDSTELLAPQNDFIAAVTALNKARSQAILAQTIETRQRSLYEGKATPLKELELAQAQLSIAQNDLRSAETQLEAARSRLRIMGRSDEDIQQLQEKGAISRTAIITSPITGTVIARKVAPGQYVRNDTPDPLFVIADMSSMWLKAFVPENEAPSIRIGDAVEVKVMAMPDKVFKARVVAIGAQSDLNTHRVMVRSEIANRDNLLKADMFATFRITSGGVETSPSVPVEAVIRHGDEAAVWVEEEPLVFKRRLVKLGLELDDRIQIREGLQAGEKLLARGAIFVDNEWRQ